MCPSSCSCFSTPSVFNNFKSVALDAVTVQIYEAEVRGRFTWWLEVGGSRMRIFFVQLDLFYENLII